MSRIESLDQEARRLFLAAAWVRPPASLLERVQRTSDPAVWEAAARAAVRASQEPLFHHFVARHSPRAPLCFETRKQLEGQLRFHAFRWEELRECLEAVIEALAEKDIHLVLLKGAACVGDCYHLPRLRPMRDIDVLVRPEEVHAAQAQLCEWGFAPNPEVTAAKYAEHHHLQPLFHPSTGVCVELHHSPLGRRAALAGVPPLAEFWQNLRACPAYAPNMVPGRASVLEPTLQVLVTCLHFTHADHISWRVSHLFDLARMIELHANEIDWERLLHQARQADLARALTFPLLYLEAEGLSTAPVGALTRLERKSGLRSWEKSFLAALVNRYRIGIPGPWRGLSGRIANIVWGEVLRRGTAAGRAWRISRQIMKRKTAPATLTDGGAIATAAVRTTER